MRRARRCGRGSRPARASRPRRGRPGRRPRRPRGAPPGCASQPQRVPLLAEADLDHLAPLLEQRGQERRLVLLALAGDELGVRVLALGRSGDLPALEGGAQLRRCGQARGFARSEGESCSVPSAASRITRSISLYATAPYWSHCPARLGQRDPVLVGGRIRLRRPVARSLDSRDPEDAAPQIAGSPG